MRVNVVGKRNCGVMEQFGGGGVGDEGVRDGEGTGRNGEGKWQTLRLKIEVRAILSSNHVQA